LVRDAGSSPSKRAGEEADNPNVSQRERKRKAVTWGDIIAECHVGGRCAGRRRQGDRENLARQIANASTCKLLEDTGLSVDACRRIGGKQVCMHNVRQHKKARCGQNPSINLWRKAHLYADLTNCVLLHLRSNTACHDATKSHGVAIQSKPAFRLLLKPL